MQPRIHVSYLREELPSLTAMFHIKAGIDIYGWHLIVHPAQTSAAFFMLEHFYAERTPTLYRSMQDDVYGRWAIDYPIRRTGLRSPLPDALAHELEQLQSAFVDDWLFFRDDPGADAEIEAYRRRGLPVLAANLRSRKLNRLHAAGHNHFHTTAGTDLNILDFLEKHWRISQLVAARHISSQNAVSSPRI